MARQIEVDGKIIREDPQVPPGVQVFWRKGNPVGSALILGGAGRAIKFDTITLNPEDFEIFAMTHKAHPGVPTAKRADQKKWRF